MNKQIISLLFILLITSFVMAPTLSIFSNAIDSSIFYSLNEEDTSTNEDLKVFKLYHTDGASHLSILDFQQHTLNTHYLTLYTPFIAECISPPPEFAV